MLKVPPTLIKHSSHRASLVMPDPCLQTCAQVLLTLDNLANRGQYLNARSTFQSLLAMGAVPIVNENDTVAVEELRFGDNDTLSAQARRCMQSTASGALGKLGRVLGLHHIRFSWLTPGLAGSKGPPDVVHRCKQGASGCLRYRLFRIELSSAHHSHTSCLLVAGGHAGRIWVAALSVSTPPLPSRLSAGDRWPRWWRLIGSSF